MIIFFTFLSKSPNPNNPLISHILIKIFKILSVPPRGRTRIVVPVVSDGILCPSHIMFVQSATRIQKMRSSFFSLFLLLFPLTFHGATGNKLIRKTCKLISQYTSNMNYDFCRTSLQAAWESYYYPNLEALGDVSLTLIKTTLRTQGAISSNI